MKQTITISNVKHEFLPGIWKLNSELIKDDPTMDTPC